MNIIRKYDGQNFYFYNKTKKKRVSDINSITRIKSLKIPPGYKNVVISNNSKSPIQATGIDSANRKQYIYNQDFIQEQQEIKFSDLIFFGKNRTANRSSCDTSKSGIFFRYFKFLIPLHTNI